MFRVSGRGQPFIYFGKEVGRFDGDEIYGSNGRYLGEFMSDNRLITSRSKKSWVRGSFGPRTSGSFARYANYAGYAIYGGPGPREQLGTVGSGNHFVDLFTDEQDRVWIGVHFGSRGLGHKIATWFLKKAGAKDGMDESIEKEA